MALRLANRRGQNWLILAREVRGTMAILPSMKSEMHRATQKFMKK